MKRFSTWAALACGALFFSACNKSLGDGRSDGSGDFSLSAGGSSGGGSSNPGGTAGVITAGEWNDIDLAEGSFTTTLYRVVGETQFTPWMALVNNIQYDTQSAVLGWQSRFRWIITPGNDLYIVYTHNWLDDAVANRFSTLDKRFATKALYTYRF